MHAVRKSMSLKAAGALILAVLVGAPLASAQPPSAIQSGPAGPPDTRVLEEAVPTDTAGGTAAPGNAAGTDEKQVLDTFADLPLTFIENHGQTDPQVRYHAHGSDYAFFFTSEKVVLSFTEEAPPASATAAAEPKTSVLAMEFLGANPQVGLEGRTPSNGQVNYLQGDDPGQWNTGLTGYSEVVYDELWPGVDMLLRGQDGELKYEFHVQPGTDPATIQLAYDGAKGLSLDSSGTMLIKTGLGTLEDSAPVSYQEIDGQRVPVESRYALAGGGEYGFDVGNYQVDQELIIDPGLDYSTFVGGSSADRSEAVTVDSEGNAVIVGSTQSTDFPTTAGVVNQNLRGGIMDAFVTKLNADGSGLVYSTYLGGTPTPTRRGTVEHTETARAAAVDAAGNVYVTGQTSSSDFPITAGTFQTTLGIGEQTATDGFVTKLNSTGGLAYSTFLGGVSSDDGRSIEVDATGNAYVAGSTFSSDFPTTTGAFDPAFDGGEDVFVTKLNASGSALAYSTYLGGAENELSHAIEIDDAGNAYVTGQTRSLEFPTTAGAFQPTHSGGAFAELFEAFVTKLNPSGSDLVYSTFLGGNDIETSHDLAVDGAGNAYVTGGTLSPTFPTTPGAFDTSFDGTSEGYVAKFNASGSDLVYSTFFDFGNNIDLDSEDNLWIAGSAGAGAPTTPDAYQPQNNGGSDVYIAQLNDSGTGLTHATFFGGPGDEGAGDIALDPLNNIYVAGTTLSASFPTTPGAFDRVWNGDASIFWGDAFVVKFSSDATTPPSTDTSQPTVNITSPTEGSILAGTVEVTATASDDVGVTEVRFFADNTLIGTDTTAPYTATWDTKSVSNDTHTLTASAHDAAGRIGGAAPVSVTVFNPAPPLTSTFSGEIDDGQTLSHSVSSGEGTVDWNLDWDETRVDLSLRVRDPQGNQVVFDDGSGQPKSGTFEATLSGSYTFQIISNTDRDTEYTLTVTHPDPTAPEPPNRDTVPPDVTITSPAPSSTVSGSVLVTADASDNVGVAQVQFLIDDIPIGTDTEAPYEAAWDTTGFTNELHSIRALVTDVSGNGGGASIPVTVDNAPEPPADTTAPAVSFTSPAPGSTVSGTVSMAASADDNTGVTEVRFFADGTLLSTDSTAPYEASWNSTTVADGPHELTASAVDAAGNTTTSEAVNVTVENTTTPPPADTTAPTVNISTPAGGSTVSGTVTVAATADDDTGVTEVQFFADGTLIGRDTTGPYEISWDTTTAANGARELTAAAVDAAGNTTTSDPVTVTVDNAVEPPADTTAPTVGISSPAGGSTVSGTVTVAATAADDTGVAQVRFSIDGTAIDTDDTAPYEISWNTANAANGEHILTATAFDAAGNASDSEPVTVTVENVVTPPADTTAPTVSISTPAAGSTVSGTTTVSATADDQGGVTEVRFFADGVLIGTDASAPYEISWDTTTAANGARELTASALDAAGNVGNSAPVTVTVDNTAPAPALTSLTLNPASVTGGNTSTGTVTVDAAAPEGGISVALESSNTAAATVPATVTIPQGSISAVFTVTTNQVISDTSSTISATHDGLTRTAILTVTPQAVDTVSISRAEYDPDENVLEVRATSSDTSATLSVYVTSTDELIGTMSGSRGEFNWPTNPENITVRSSLGGSDTSGVQAD